MKRDPFDDDARDSRRKLLAGLAASAAGVMVGCARAVAAPSAPPEVSSSK